LNRNCLEGVIHLWDRESGEMVRSFVGHSGYILHLRWNSVGDRFLSASWDATVRIWDIDREEELAVLEHQIRMINGAMWSPDGDKIITFTSSGLYELNNVNIWDVNSGELFRQLSPTDSASDQLISASLNKEGSQILTFFFNNESEYNYAQIWDVDSGEVLWRAVHDGGGSSGISSWSPDESLIVAGSTAGVVRVWNVANEKESWSLKAHDSYILSAAWSPDGELIATSGSDFVVKLFNSQTGDLVRTISGFTDYVHEIKWLSNGLAIVTITGDKVQIWDSQTGKELTSMGYGQELSSIDLSNDERLLLTTGKDGSVRAWYTQMVDLLEAACEIAPRNMAADEWETYFPESLYRKTCPQIP